MKYLFTFTALSLTFFFACNDKKSETKSGNTAKYSLEKLWESDTVFTTVESAIYDANTNMIYVSNIDGEPWAEDGNGSIGRLNMDRANASNFKY